ncbi:hypothetical protein N7539_008378 [Penicillium diatomitis]|uniref:Uncharacterized protein n=1 Tax=Penicillium diatomitis TaxID=2819901 RepID=A0A9W9WUF6_9EURO|nr:uncharacterized protein N7539_008378 [Penicillium diatomitis]KAJ5475312.1 hypothetical protein N7539_008378 [Penicillium diatomitis]
MRLSTDYALRNVFFDQYPQFNYNPSTPITNEFARLAKTRKWRLGTRVYRENQRLCVRYEYKFLVGDRTELETLQLVCEKIGLAGDLSSIAKCKKALNQVNINIFDLLDGWKTGEIPLMWPTAKALSVYTVVADKVFPRGQAERDAVLRILIKRLN